MNPRAFDLDSHQAFVTLSGDDNPIHVDPLVARRLLYGKPVVHGLHTALRALEWLLGTVSNPVAGREMTRFEATFRRPVGINETFEMSVRAVDERGAEVHVNTDAPRSTVVSVRFGPAPTPSPHTELALDERVVLQPARAMALEELAGATGRLPLALDCALARRLFPLLEGTWGPTRLAGILALTRMVGTVCPGLHSLFGGLEADLGPVHVGARATLEYRVTEIDARFRRATIVAAAPGIFAVVHTFVPPGPCAQRSAHELRGTVDEREFGDQRALVVGGSRGLGEVTAKLLAAGGADVWLTYHVGADDAMRVVDEIEAAGGRVRCSPLDVRRAAEGLGSLTAAGWAPTHLYYFATPSIFDGREERFSAARFRRFTDYYVSGLAAVLEGLGPARLEGVFVPSSVAVDAPTPSLAEYGAAKAAGEAACRAWARRWHGCVFSTPRLGRLATDQTMTIHPVDNGDPVDVLRTSLRSLKEACRGARRDTA